MRICKFFGIATDADKPTPFNVRESPAELEKRKKNGHKMNFRVYALSQTDIDSVVTEIEELCADVVKDKVLNSDKQQETISKLSDSQVSLIQTALHWSVFWRFWLITL